MSLTFNFKNEIDTSVSLLVTGQGGRQSQLIQQVLAGALQGPSRLYGR